MLDWAGGKLLVSNRLIKNSVSSEITSKGTLSTFFKIVGDSGPIRVEGGGGRGEGGGLISLQPVMGGQFFFTLVRSLSLFFYSLNSFVC